MMNTVNTGFSSVEVWFTYQVSKALEIEGNVNPIQDGPFYGCSRMGRGGVGGGRPTPP